MRESTRKISFDDKIRCAQRELALRRRMYPKWVDKGTMEQDKAEWEIEVMEAIVQQLEQDAGRRLL